MPNTAPDTHYPEPRITRFLFASMAMAPLWTIVRIYLGWQWLILATWVVLAWRVAGYYGLDFWILPRIGAPHGGFGSGKPTSVVREPEPYGQH